MFNKVIDAPMEFFDGCSNGAIVSRISNDGRSVSEFITNFFVVVVKNIVLIIMIIIGMLMLSKEITLMVIFFICNIFFLLTGKYHVNLILCLRVSKKVMTKYV